MQIPGAVSQASDSVAGRLEGIPLLLPGATVEAQAKVLLSILVIVVLVLARRLLLYLLGRVARSGAPRYRWARYSSNAITILAIVILAQVWFTAIRSMGVFLGLLSAGLAIALKDLVASLAGWFIILWRKPFDLGDRVQVGAHAGDVVDIRLFAFTIMEVGNWPASDQATGRMIHLPNSRVFTEPVANYTADFPFLWSDLPVLVTFESDWRRAKDRLQEILDDVAAEASKEAESRLAESSRLFLVHHGGLMPEIYTSVEESGVLLTGHYITRPRERRATSLAIWERVLDAFQEEPAVAFAYPTQRLRVDAPEWAPAPSQTPTVAPGGPLPAP